MLIEQAENPQPVNPPAPANDDEEAERQVAAALDAIRKGLANV